MPLMNIILSLSKTHFFLSFTSIYLYYFYFVSTPQLPTLSLFCTTPGIRNSPM